MNDENEYKKEIDEWLSKKEPKVIQKFWVITSALNDEWQIRDQDEFKVPHNKLRTIDDPKDLEAILSSLHNKKFIDVSGMLGKTKDSNGLSFSVWAPITDENHEILDSIDTRIKIFPQRFLHLIKRLDELHKKQSEKVVTNTEEDEVTITISQNQRINEYYWWVLGRIKEQLDTTPSNKPIRYELSHVGAAGVPNNETEENIIRKLEELKVLRIIKETPRTWQSNYPHTFELKVLQPNFDKYYQKYQQFEERPLTNKSNILPNFNDIPNELVQAILWILREIKKEYTATPTGEQIYILFKGAIRYAGQPKVVPDIEEQRRAVETLEKIGAIKVSSYTYPQSKPGNYIRPKGVLLYVSQPNFDKIYQTLGTINNNKSPHSSSENFTTQRTSLQDKYDKLIDEIRPDDKSLEEKYSKLLNEIRPVSSIITKQEQSATENKAKPTITPVDEKYSCGSLLINLSAATLKYKDNPEVDIQPKNREIKFLVMLIKNKRVVGYSEIASEINSTTFGEEVLTRAVQYLKRDSKPILLSAGMTSKEINKMILSVRNTGYKIVCPQ